MALIRRTELHSMVYDPVPVDMEDVRLRAQQLREQAEEYAKRTVEGGNAEREQLIAGAAEIGRDQGFQQGYDEGMEKGKAEGAAQAKEQLSAELESLRSGWIEALGEFRAGREDLLERARDDVLELACAIACKVVRRAVELDGSAVQAQLRAVLEAHARPTRLFVRVNPADEKLAREALPELMATLTGGDHVELELDESVPRGSCRALTDGAGVIDAGIDGQLDRIVRELLPDRPGANPAGAPAPTDEPEGELGDAA